MTSVIGRWPYAVCFKSLIYETLGELTPSLFWWCSKAQIYSDENQYIFFLYGIKSIVAKTDT